MLANPSDRVVSFRAYCRSTLHMTVKETQMATVFKQSTFGRNKIKLDNFIFRECGFTSTDFQQNKIIALAELRKYNIPYTSYTDNRHNTVEQPSPALKTNAPDNFYCSSGIKTNYSNIKSYASDLVVPRAAYIILTYENFIRFTKSPLVTRQMTNISRSQMIRFMSICQTFDDLYEFKIHSYTHCTVPAVQIDTRNTRTDIRQFPPPPSYAETCVSKLGAASMGVTTSVVAAALPARGGVDCSDRGAHYPNTSSHYSDFYDWSPLQPAPPPSTSRSTPKRINRFIQKVGFSRNQ